MAEKKPHVHVIGTGGTIAFSPTNALEAIDPTNTRRAGIEELLPQVPMLAEVAEITAEQIFTTGSTAMTDRQRIILAKRVSQVLKDEGVDGVVITHGTDTMEETAYFLSLTVHSKKPIVLTGAMRPATAFCQEGPLNLYNAVLVAGSPKSVGMGAFIAMDEMIYAARDVIKSNTTRTCAFSGTEYGTVGKVVDGKVYFAYQTTKRHTVNSEFDIEKIDELPRVDIVYGYPDSGDELLLAAQKLGAVGVVVACTGSGVLHPALRNLYEHHHDTAPIMVRSSRIFQGGTMLNNLNNDDAYQSVASGDLSPQKARVLLMLALTKTRDIGELRRYFDEY